MLNIISDGVYHKELAYIKRLHRPQNHLKKPKKKDYVCIHQNIEL